MPEPAMNDNQHLQAEATRDCTYLFLLTNRII
jgi:hypothetical protein